MPLPRAGAPVLTTAQMRAAEQAIFDAGTHPYALMVQAGEGAAEMIWRTGHRREALVLCGPGNNGGDGYVIARALRERGVPVRVAATAEPKTESARQARADWGGPVEDIMTAEPATQLIDAIFGVGQTRPLEPGLATRLGELVEAAQIAYAVDVPSGVDSDSGALLGPKSGNVPGFDLVLAIGAWKPSHWLMPAMATARRLALVEIGIAANDAQTRLLAAPHLAAPSLDAHKYKRGLVAVVAGAMPGAAALSAEAAARGGAGYVRLVGAQAIVPASHAIVRVSPRDPLALDDRRIGALLVGPGLGRDDTAKAKLAAVLDTGLPGVIDADALALIDVKHKFREQSILTPHAGEFAALFPHIEGINKIEITRHAAASTGAVIVHKGPDTVIAAPDGRCIVARPASSWLSTAGTGDVLAGLCAARLAVTGDAFRAACEAVWLHGEAARRAGASFIADDLAAHIPDAIASRT